MSAAEAGCARLTLIVRGRCSLSIFDSSRLVVVSSLACVASAADGYGRCVHLMGHQGGKGQRQSAVRPDQVRWAQHEFNSSFQTCPGAGCGRPCLFGNRHAAAATHQPRTSPVHPARGAGRHGGGAGHHPDAPHRADRGPSAQHTGGAALAGLRLAGVGVRRRMVISIWRPARRRWPN